MSWFKDYNLLLKDYKELSREHRETCIRMGEAQGRAIELEKVVEWENDRGHQLLAQLMALKRDGFKPEPEGVDYSALESALPKEVEDAILERCDPTTSTYHEMVAWSLDQMRMGTGTKDIVNLLLKGSDESI